jgi:hypothetical protein
MLGVLIIEWVCLARRAQHGVELFLRVPPAGVSPTYRALRFPARGFGAEAGNR